MKTIFSGIQPTGIAHLGNYLGAIRNWTALQIPDNECYFCLVDQHAITIRQDPKLLRDQTKLNAAILMACGINSDFLFVQSTVPAHTKLAWIFNCIARVGWLNRMTQFKDKGSLNVEMPSVSVDDFKNVDSISAIVDMLNNKLAKAKTIFENTEGPSTGLYVYPNLMAADIHCYGTTHVPVGNDQIQHLQLANDIAAKFNRDYEVDFFPKITPLLMPTARVMNLQDGSIKMSKSAESDFSRINLTDSNDLIVKKIKKAKSHTEFIHTLDNPEAANLLSILAALTDTTVNEQLEDFTGIGYGHLKAALSDAIIAEIEPIRIKTEQLMSDFDISVLRESSMRANIKANSIIEKVEEIVGFLK